jgi:di/tricarboxylate transporter
MEAEILIVFIILIITVVLLITEVVRIDVVAILCMLALGWSGILEPSEMLSGFSSNAVIAMMAVMIMGYGITKTGIIDKLIARLIFFTGNSWKKNVFYTSLLAGLASGFIINIGAASLFLPGIINISRKTKIAPSQLLMPIGFAILLGGTLTMIGSSHLLLVNDLLKNENLESFDLLDVTPVGIILLLAGIAYFVFLGKRLLPQPKGENSQKSDQEKLVESLHLPSKIWHFTIPQQCNLIDQTTEQSGIWKQFNINIVGLSEQNGVIYAPSRETRFMAGQKLALLGAEENIQAFVDHHQLIAEPLIKDLEKLSDPDQAGFAEVIIRPRSEFIGQTMRKMAMRRRFAVEPAKLFSKGEEMRGDFSDHQITAGDTIIVFGLWDHIKEIRNYTDFVVATPFYGETKDQTKILAATLCFGFSIALAVAGFPIALSFLTGVAGMILTRVISIQQAYKAIDWKVIFLLAGLIPLGIAMQKSGTSQYIAMHVMELVMDKHPIVFMLAIGIIATLFSLFMSNVGAIVVLAPLVINMSIIGGFDPRIMVLFAAICVSNSLYCQPNR